MFSQRMKKLLFLLPLALLAACSGGHDLMSDKPFRITCVEEGKDADPVVILVSPDLPQATVLLAGSKVMPELTYELVKKTPIRLELRRKGHVISINRETAQISMGVLDGDEVVAQLKPLPGNSRCSVETL